MNFKAKCAVQTVFSYVPGGVKLNYLCQKHITKGLPIGPKKFQQLKERADKHLDLFLKHSPFPVEETDYYEFGAGWDLVNPIALSQAGFRQLHCIDIRELVCAELIKSTMQYLGITIPEPITQKNYRAILQKYFRINYTAPMDAQKTTFKDNSIGFICSSATMEHISGPDIQYILKDCRRILKPGGIITCNIDYRDHWAFEDSTISEYNFLRFNYKEWKRLNPPLHYQNRLRHKDYRTFFKMAGFEVLEEDIIPPTQNDIDILAQILPNAPVESLYQTGIKKGWFVLQKQG